MYIVYGTKSKVMNQMNQLFIDNISDQYFYCFIYFLFKLISKDNWASLKKTRAEVLYLQLTTTYYKVPTLIM